MNDLYSYIATFASGAILTHLWERFVRRITVLRYNVLHQNLALTGNDPRFGSIEVLHNKMPVTSLYLSTVTISNDSSRDITDLTIEAQSDDSSIILLAYGINKSSLKHIYFTDKYSKSLTDAKPEYIDAVLRYRDFVIPVLNRGSIVELSLLITNTTVPHQPFVAVTCDHPGVKMRFQPAPPQKLFNESQSLSALIGILVTVAVCYLIIDFKLHFSTAVWYSFILGLFSATIGAFVIKLLKLLRRTFT